MLGILNKICEKAPADCLTGYTPENKKAFKEYKKESNLNKELIGIRVIFTNSGGNWIIKNIF